MNKLFDKSDIDKINSILSVQAQDYGNAFSWKLTNKDNTKPMVVTLYNEVNTGNDRSSLISVQTRHGYYELHDVTNYLIFEPDEIIFINASETKLSSLIIGKECTCSLYSNINREILKADFSDLDSAVLLSAMQLSITENLLP